MTMFGKFVDQGWPPKPTLTEKELGDLTGKVYIVTGGYAGVGLRLVKILYDKNATVYVAGRREEQGRKAIREIQQASPASRGRLEFLLLDLADLANIKPSADAFLARESRLDVLFNNAGVMRVPTHLKTPQGHDLTLGTNCLGPFLFTKLLHPLLEATAKTAPAGAVRVVWLGSMTIDLEASKHGMDLGNLDYRKKDEPSNKRYAVSKTGNYFLGAEWARRDAGTGIVHLTANPGNLKTDLQRTMGAVTRTILNTLLLHDAVYGAYTELWAGLSPAVKPSDSGRYVIPWGRLGSVRKDIEEAARPEAEGGLGMAAKFFEYCDEQTKSFA